MDLLKLFYLIFLSPQLAKALNQTATSTSSKIVKAATLCRSAAKIRMGQALWRAHNDLFGGGPVPPPVI